jgi:hypothetical protein
LTQVSNAQSPKSDEQGAGDELRKSVTPRLEGCFTNAEHSQRFAAARARTPHDATRSGDLDCKSATKADPDRNMSDSTSIYPFLRQHCPTFQLLGLSRAIAQHDEDGAIQCLPDRRNPV